MVSLPQARDARWLHALLANTKLRTYNSASCTHRLKLGWPGVWLGGARFVAGCSSPACEGAGAVVACDSDTGLGLSIVAAVFD